MYKTQEFPLKSIIWSFGDDSNILDKIVGLEYALRKQFSFFCPF